jgi:hypothetical protein
MTTKIAIQASYYTGAEGYATLPDDKTWADVEDWYIKWDTLNLKFKGQEKWECIALDSDSGDSTDWKRPISASIHPTTEDGTADYDEELDSKE